MKASDYLGGMWMRSSDLEGPTEFRIEAVAVGEIDGKEHLTLEFYGSDKKLGLNVTNTKSLISLHGDDTDAWIGKRIILVETEVDYRGELVPAIRISKKLPPGDDDIHLDPEDGPATAEAKQVIWHLMKAKNVDVASAKAVTGKPLETMTVGDADKLREFLNGMGDKQTQEEIPF